MHYHDYFTFSILSLPLIAVSKAYKLLQDEDETKKILQVIDDGKALANKKVRTFTDSNSI